MKLENEVVNRVENVCNSVIFETMAIKCLGIVTVTIVSRCRTKLINVVSIELHSEKCTYRKINTIITIVLFH